RWRGGWGGERGGRYETTGDRRGGDGRHPGGNGSGVRAAHAGCRSHDGFRPGHELLRRADGFPRGRRLRAPRQGVLNAQDGVFFRLAIATFGYQHDVGNGDNWTSAISVYTPFNRRFELRWDIPLILSNRGSIPGADYPIPSPDFALTPRFALSETEDSAQSLDVTFRMPTGDTINNQGQAAVTPWYNFWVNPWAGFVARGGVGFGIPFGNQSVNELMAR